MYGSRSGAQDGQPAEHGTGPRAPLAAARPARSDPHRKTPRPAPEALPDDRGRVVRAVRQHLRCHARRKPGRPGRLLGGAAAPGGGRGPRAACRELGHPYLPGCPRPPPDPDGGQPRQQLEQPRTGPARGPGRLARRAVPGFRRRQTPAAGAFRPAPEVSAPRRRPALPAAPRPRPAHRVSSRRPEFRCRPDQLAALTFVWDDGLMRRLRTVAAVVMIGGPLLLAACAPAAGTPAREPAGAAAHAAPRLEEARSADEDAARTPAVAIWHRMELGRLQQGGYTSNVLEEMTDLPRGVAFFMDSFPGESFELRVTDDAVPGVWWLVTPDGISRHEA